MKQIQNVFHFEVEVRDMNSWHQVSQTSMKFIQFELMEDVETLIRVAVMKTT